MTWTAPGRPPERLAFHLEAAGRPFDAAVAWRRGGRGDPPGPPPRGDHHARRAIADPRPARPRRPDGGETRRRVADRLAVAMQGCRYGTAELLEVVAEARAGGVGADDLAERLVLDVMEVSALHEQGEFGATKVAELAGSTTGRPATSCGRVRPLRFLGACHVWRGELAVGIDELEQASTSGTASAAVRSAPTPRGRCGRCSAWPRASPIVTTPIAAARPARAVIPADDGYTRCLVAATAAMADQLADRPATVRAAVEPVWCAGDGPRQRVLVRLGPGAARLGGRRRGRPGRPGDDAETVDDGRDRQTKPYFLYLLGVAAVRARAHREAWPVSTRG